MPILDVSNASCASMQILSVMLFPGNQSERVRFVELARAASADALAYSQDAENFKPEDRLHLHQLGFQGRFFEAVAVDAAERRTKIAQTEIHPGRLAGQMLFIPLMAALKYGRNDVGRNQSFRLLSDGLDKEKRNLQSIWSKYKQAAHLWAALEFASIDDDAFLSFAESMGEWGLHHVPHHASDALMPVDRWAVMPSEDLGAEYLRRICEPLDFRPEWRRMLCIDQ